MPDGLGAGAVVRVMVMGMIGSLVMMVGVVVPGHVQRFYESNRFASP